MEIAVNILFKVLFIYNNQRKNIFAIKTTDNFDICIIYLFTREILLLRVSHEFYKTS